MIPSGLLVLALILPAAVGWLHGRYVLRLESEGDVVRVTTLQCWGRRTREVSRADLADVRVTGAGDEDAPAFRLRQPAAGIDWLIDRRGRFPEGEEALLRLVGRRDS